MMQRRTFISLSAAVAALAAAGIPASALADESGTLIVGSQSENLPLKPESARSRFYTRGDICETLVFLDKDMVLQPGLATSWERVSKEVWRFNLRAGVLFHDGTTFDAASVKNALEKITALMPYAEQLLQLKEVRVIDPVTVEIETLAPFASLPNQLSDAVTVIHAPASYGADGKFIKPIGTGAWTFVDFIPGDRTILERFDGYWGAQKPAFRRVEYVTIPDDQTRVIALESGEIDILMDVPRGDARRLSETAGLQLLAEPISGISYGAYNCAEGRVLADVNLRLALNYLVDRELVVAAALDGYGRPAWQFFPPGYSWLPQDVTPYRFDVAEAEKYFAAAGYARVDGKWSKDGKPLVLNVQSYHSGTSNGYIAEAMVAILAREGVDCTLNMGTYDGMVEFVKRGDYDVAVQYWTPELTADPDLHLTSQFKSDASMNWQGWKNDRFDALVDEGRTLDRGAEWDGVYAEVQQILQDDAPILPLVHAVLVNAARADLRGLEIHPTRLYNLKSVSL